MTHLFSLRIPGTLTASSVFDSRSENPCISFSIDVQYAKTNSVSDCRLDRRNLQAAPAVLESLREDVVAQQAAQSTPDTVAAYSMLEGRAEKVNQYGWRPDLFASFLYANAFSGIVIRFRACIGARASTKLWLQNTYIRKHCSCM